MNVERMNAVIAALESGEYKFTKWVMRNGDSYCTVGAMADLYMRESGKGEWKKTIGYPNDYYYTVGSDLAIEEWYDISNCDLDCIINENDNIAKDFNHMADYLRSLVDSCS